MLWYCGSSLARACGGLATAVRSSVVWLVGRPATPGCGHFSMTRERRGTAVEPTEASAPRTGRNVGLPGPAGRLVIQAVNRRALLIGRIYEQTFILGDALCPWASNVSRVEVSDLQWRPSPVTLGKSRRAIRGPVRNCRCPVSPSCPSGIRIGPLGSTTPDHLAPLTRARGSCRVTDLSARGCGSPVARPRAPPALHEATGPAPWARPSLRPSAWSSGDRPARSQNSADSTSMQIPISVDHARDGPPSGVVRSATLPSSTTAKRVITAGSWPGTTDAPGLAASSRSFS